MNGHAAGGGGRQHKADIPARAIGSAARRWLNEPAKALGGSSPIDYLDTEAAAEALHDLILRLEHGVIT